MSVVLIAGGGISGLYCAYILITKYNINPNNIIICEKSSRWGGRVQTLKHNDIFYEKGAGRIPESHKLIKNLIETFDLKSKLVKISNDKQFKYFLENNEIDINQDDLENMLKKLQNISENSIKNNKDYLINLSLTEFCQKQYGIIETNLLKNYFGYDSEFDNVNAFDGICAMKNDFNLDQNFYILNGGFEQIINNLVDFLKNKIDMRLKTKLIDWKYNNNKIIAKISDINNNIESLEIDKLVLTLDQWKLLQLKPLNSIHKYLNTVYRSSLTRIYAQFPIENGKSWFYGIPKTITNLPIRMFIPIDEKKGFCMISYSDDKFAIKWQNSNLNGTIKKQLMKHIKKLFSPINIPEPTFIKTLHWTNGTHLWLPGVDSKQISKIVQNPLPNIYICGETFSKKQGWMEGALETTEQICKIINKKQFIKQNKRIDNKLNLIKIPNYIKNSNNLTIINNKIYDLTKKNWINTHPGGEIIKNAIGKDATFMFNYVGHSDLAHKILKELYVGKLL